MGGAAAPDSCAHWAALRSRSRRSRTWSWSLASSAVATMVSVRSISVLLVEPGVGKAQAPQGLDRCRVDAVARALPAAPEKACEEQVVAGALRDAERRA